MKDDEKQQLEALATVAHESAAILEVFEIRDDEDRNLLAESLKEISAQKRQLEALRKTITRPMDDAKKRVMSLFRTPIERLDRVTREQKKALLAYDKKREEQRQQAPGLAAQLHLDGDAEGARTAIQLAAVPEKAKGVSVARVLRVEVVDIDQVPDEYVIKTLDKKAALAVGKKGGEIPGLKFYHEEQVRA
jgi:hypothetical protein